jgi:hypothetical protein
MLVCPLVNKNGRIKTYRGFELYKYVSENSHPGRIVKYKGYLPRKQLVTKPHKKLSDVKKDIDHIIDDYIVCPFLKDTFTRTKKGGRRRCVSTG